jgi:hypothetical protein
MLSTQLGTLRGRYDEHSSKFPSVVKPRFIKLVGESQTSEGDACKLRDTLDNGARRILVGEKLFTSSNVEPAHNTTKNFAPTYYEVVNLTGLL